MDYSKYEPYFFKSEKILGWASFPTLIAVIYPPKYIEATNYFFGRKVNPPFVDIEGSDLLKRRKDFQEWTFRVPTHVLSEPSTKARIKNTPLDVLNDYITAMCTGFHEVHHIKQAASSTVGWWLATNEIDQLANVGNFLKRVKKAGEKTVRIPLWKWGKQTSTSNERWTYELRKLTDYLFRTSFIKAALTGSVPISIDEAVKGVSEIFTSRQLDIQLSTALDPGYPASPYGMTLVDLLESEARFFADQSVLGLWELAGAPKDVIKSFRSRMNFGPYVKAAEVSKSILGPCPPPRWGELFQIAIHIALFSPMFKPRFDNASLSYKWEDIHPCWRFVKVLDILSEIALPEEPLRECEYLTNSICAKLKWHPTPLEIMSEIANIDSSCSRNPIHRDLLDRLAFFSSYVVQKGLPTLLPFTQGDDTNIWNRMSPWFRQSGDKLSCQNIPPWISRQDAAEMVVCYLILNDAINNCHLSHSKAIHNAWMQHSIENKRNTIEEREEYFDELVRVSLGCAFKAVLPA